jgi:hypothetical protein
LPSAAVRISKEEIEVYNRYRTFDVSQFPFSGTAALFNQYLGD